MFRNAIEINARYTHFTREFERNQQGELLSLSLPIVRVRISMHITRHCNTHTHTHTQIIFQLPTLRYSFHLVTYSWYRVCVQFYRGVGTVDIPVVNSTVAESPFWPCFMAYTPTVYLVAGSRDPISNSTVFPDTCTITGDTAGQ